MNNKQIIRHVAWQMRAYRRDMARSPESKTFHLAYLQGQLDAVSSLLLADSYALFMRIRNARHRITDRHFKTAYRKEVA